MTTQAEESPRDEHLSPWQRWLLISIGVGLLICGVVATFTGGVDGISVAALLAAGFAVTFVGFLGQYITKIKFREFEASLQEGVKQIQEGVGQVQEGVKKVETQVQRVQEKADEALAGLDASARAYKVTRSQMAPGGARDTEMSIELEKAMRIARDDPPGASRVQALFRSDDKGDRITALAAVKANPDLWDFESVEYAIANPHSGYDQDRCLTLAADMLHRLSPREREQLRNVITEQRDHGEIRPDRIRWLTSERLLRLLDR